MQKIIFYKSAISFILFMTISSVVAQTSDFGIEINCFQGCYEKIIDSNGKIILELVLKNNYPYWIKFSETPSLMIQLSHQELGGGKQYEYHREILGKNSYIKPKDEIKIYIPFETYNSLDQNERIGRWVLKPELHIGNNIEYYNDYFDGKKVSPYNNDISAIIVGSQIELIAKGDDVKIEKGVFSGWWNIWNIITGWFESRIGWIVAMVIAGVLIFFFTNKKKK